MTRLAPEPANPTRWASDPNSLPLVQLHSTDRQKLQATISVNGVARVYSFLTSAELDTLEFLFRKISAMKALNYAKKHSEKSEMVG